MARYTLVYGLRLVPEGTLARTEDVRLQLTDGETTGLTLHTIDGTIPQLAPGARPQPRRVLRVSARRRRRRPAASSTIRSVVGAARTRGRRTRLQA